VIVIMGILAAVAVPKLFGMIAKSKASEVPTAAGTYINMQDAYVVEANDIGTWAKIGYTGPGSNSASGAQSAVFLYTEGESAPQWNASPVNSKLNDCGTDESWELSAYKDDSEEGQTNVKYNADGDDDCTALTPSFVNLHSGRFSDGS